jgi:release factor glutamine methyltransferase
LTCISDLLRDAVQQLTPVSSSARLDAQLLLAEAIGRDRAYVLAYGEVIPTTAQTAQFKAWLARRAKGEPMAYIFGRRAFYDREFYVTADVLIPRPETEHLLEAGLAFAGDRELVAVDVGTGSGAIAVSFKGNCPQATVYAVDVSPQALAVAQKNAGDLTITFLQGDLLTPLIENSIEVDLLMANLPYIPHDEMLTLAVSHHEPHLALDGGEDGLILIRQLLKDAPKVCRAGACILLEHGAGQSESILQIGRDVFPDGEWDVIFDYAGHDRVVRGIV